MLTNYVVETKEGTFWVHTVYNQSLLIVLLSGYPDNNSTTFSNYGR